METLSGIPYGTIVYHDIGGRSQVSKTYGEEGSVGITVRDFNKYRVDLNVYPSGIALRDGTVKRAFIVSVEFCICRDINDPRYLPEDEERLVSELQDVPRRAANVNLTTLRVRYVRELIPHTLVTVISIRDIVPREELFMDYGDH